MNGTETRQDDYEIESVSSSFRGSLFSKVLSSNCAEDKIELYKRNSKEKAVIINNDLFNTLLEITKDTRYNNAYKCHPITASNVLVWNEGIVSPYNE